MNDAFRHLFDQVSSGIVWVQRNGMVRYANKAAVQLTPCVLGRAFTDPMVDRTIKAAGQGLVQLPFQFDIATQEVNPDQIRAVILNAPVGNDLMLVLNNVSKESWYANALENLISYIGAEMAKPIEQLVVDLQALGTLGSEPAAMRAQANAQQLSEKLSKLRDLVTVFGQGAIQRDDRIEYRELVKGVLSGVTLLAAQRGVTLALNGFDNELPTVYGSQAWLSRAVSEYLEHSVRSAKQGGLIELSAQTVGTHIVLRARNQGLFLSNHQRRSAFIPFGVGDGQPSADRPSIGLALAQRIVEQHGGKVRIEDDMDGVDFILEVPAGAPATQDAQLSIEQAQRYAHDMSELMERSHKKTKQAH